MKKFDIPEHYRSGIIGAIKESRKNKDPKKKDFVPTTLDFGEVRFLLPRHFGFCYGVENAIERSYKAIDENPHKKIYLLSQMIHNPAVNEDLEANGITFIMDTDGRQLIQWDVISSDDIVIIPAFGTTIEIEEKLNSIGVETATYNTTCPFVEKVWKRSAEIGVKGYTVIIHGKLHHEETRATFSHSYQNGPSVIIRDMKEAELLADFISGKLPESAFEEIFGEKSSKGFDPKIHLDHVGVVNQTTMLATETQEIADFFKKLMMEKYGEDYKAHFADTRDTLCYATNDNQQATLEILNHPSDFAVVVGGYNSSNTAQLVSILERKMPVYFVLNEANIISPSEILHFDYGSKELKKSTDWLQIKERPSIVLTSGASCPDTILEAVMEKIMSFFVSIRSVEEVIAESTTLPDIK
jgi:4-hydroxy-3-methylbut-2-en-1-yl diphosphate reductase